jgi:hypothetical protein
MKKIKIYIALALLFLTVGFAGAQTASDAFNFSQCYNEGTARTLGMGNAFTALGGDLGALSLQPASSGVFGHSEMTFTPSLAFATSQTNYLNTTTNSSYTFIGMSNFAAVFHLENSGINFAISENRVRDFYSVLSAHGTTNESSWLSSQAAGLTGYNSNGFNSTDPNAPFNDGISWEAVNAWNAYLLSNLPDSKVDYLASTENIDEANKSIYVGGNLNQNQYVRTDGGVYEISFNAGGNLNDILYWGANLNLQTLTYNVFRTYSEQAQNVADFQDGFDFFQSEYDQKTSGTGFNLKAGVIYRPTDGLRIGAAIQTPTWFTMQDQYRYYIESSFYTSDGTNKKYGFDGDIYSPLGTYSYRMTSPFRFNLGAAYTFGNIALISADYDFANYSQMAMNVYDRSSAIQADLSYFADVNSQIKNYYPIVHGFRIGGEIKPVPMIALRAGFQDYGYFSGNNVAAGFGSSFYSLQKLLSFGVGFNLSDAFFIDCAYQLKLNKASQDTFTCYNDYGDASSPVHAPVGNILKDGNDKLLLTVGFRF